MNIPIKCIFAIDINNGIADDIGIPWNIKEDLNFFKETTTNCKGKKSINAIIMGRKTYESIGKILKGRLNVILTSSAIENENVPNILIPSYFTNLFNAIDWISKQNVYYIESIFIIGGKQLYDECITYSLCDEIYITKIMSNYKTNVIIDTSILNFTHNITSSKKIIVNDINNIEKNKIEVEFIKYEKNIKSIKNKEEYMYLTLMKKIITDANLRPTRNANTYALFGKSLEFNLKNEFPLLTTKKLFLRGIFEELKFFLSGNTNTKILENKGVNIWKGNTSRKFLDDNSFDTYEEGDMGPMYGFQLVHFGAKYEGCNSDYTNRGINQLNEIVNLLINDKFSRRILMTTYNPSQAKEGVLYPCHGLTIQFAVEGINNNELVCAMYQRSGDYFLGVPYNIASYSLLVHIICNIVNNNVKNNIEKIYPGRLIMFLGDVHVYEGHLEAVNKQLKNEANRFPWLKINKELKSFDDINNLEFSDIDLIGYNSCDTITATMYA